MNINQKMTEILEYILRHATRYELELMSEALQKRMKQEPSLGLGQLDVYQMARDMADGIDKQMGLGADKAHQMSRRLVSDMIRGEKPDISEFELQKLLDQFVPKTATPAQGGIPKEMLLTMITQFIEYSSGEMSEKDNKEFPTGWYKKYWEAFPRDIQLLIKNFLAGTSGKNEFWRGIREYMADIK